MALAASEGENYDKLRPLEIPLAFTLKNNNQRRIADICSEDCEVSGCVTRSPSRWLQACGPRGSMNGSKPDDLATDRTVR